MSRCNNNNTMENHHAGDADDERRRGRHDDDDGTAAAAASLPLLQENGDDAHQNALYFWDDDDDSSSASSSASFSSLVQLAATNTSTTLVQRQSPLQEPKGTMPPGKKKNTNSNDNDDFQKNDGICHSPPPRKGAAVANGQKQKVNNTSNNNNKNATASNSISNMKVYYGDSDDPTSDDDDDDNDDEDDISVYGDDGDEDCLSMYRTTTTTTKRGTAASKSKSNNNKTNGMSHHCRRRQKSGSYYTIKNPSVQQEQRRQQQWEAMVQQLLQFRSVHGHCNVPSTYAPNQRLSNFVSNQRIAYSYRQRGITKPGTRRITLDRIQKLEQMGFLWRVAGTTAATTTTAAAVAAMNTAAPQEEAEEEGDDNIIEQQENEAADEEMSQEEEKDDNDENSRQGGQHVSVVQGEFRNTCHRRRRTTTTTTTTTSPSNAVVIQSPSSLKNRQHQQRRWEILFNQLLDFRKKEGHCHVPTRYLQNQQLAKWLENQINAHSRIQRGLDDFGARITKERIERLTEIGVSWKSSALVAVAATAAATTAAATTCTAQQQHRNENIMPQEEEEDDDDDELVVESSSRQGAPQHGVVQGEYSTASHRRRPALSMMTTRPTNVASPTAVQEPSLKQQQQQQQQHQRFEAMYTMLLQFKQRYGHTAVPRKVPKLGMWVMNLRSAFRRKQRGMEHTHAYRLTPQRLERLNAIDFVWDAREFAAVPLVHNDGKPQEKGDDDDDDGNHDEEMSQDEDGEMESQGENHESRSNENVNGNASSATTMTSSTTAVAQKRQHKSVSKESNQQQNQSWDTMLDLFVAYKNQHGHFVGIKQNNAKLEQWMRNQRSAYWRKQRGEERNHNYKAYCITQEKIQRLSDLGFPWETFQHHSIATTAFHDQQPQENGVMVRTTPMMDAAATTAFQEEPRLHKRSVRKLVARKSSITGATSSSRKKSITATTAYHTNPRDSEHIQQSPSQCTHLSYSAVHCGTGTGQDEGTAVASRSNGHRKRKRHGSVSADSSEQSSSITTIEACSETIHFEDIVGHITAKMQIEDILHSLLDPPESIDDSDDHEFTYLTSQPTSILMHGPSGCGKTLLARAIAGEAKAAFLSIAPNDIRGDLKTAARSIFQQAQEHAICHRESNCAVIFIDDIDDVSRDNQCNVQDCTRGVLQELFLQLDIIIARQKQQNGTTSDAHVLIVAATNCLGDCDSALVRRFGAHLQVGLPSEHDRKEMLTRYVAEFDNVITQDEIISLSKKTNGWSGSELKNLTREAAMTPMREYLQVARKRREKLQETRGRLPVPNEGMVSVEECSSIPLRAVELADLEKCYGLRFDTAV